MSVWTSRWVNRLCFDSNRYSIGSSMVTMCLVNLLFNHSRQEARVVDFPDPVGPVMRTIPEAD